MCSTRNCLCGITPEVKMLMLLLGFTLLDIKNVGDTYLKSHHVVNGDYGIIIHLYYRSDCDRVYVRLKQPNGGDTIQGFGIYEDKNIACYLTKLLEN